MALPLIIAGIGAFLLGAVSVAAIYSPWKGRSITILGPRGSGKTTISEFLRNGEIPESPSQTVRTTKHKLKEPLKIKELELKISEIEDLSGDKSEYTEWKESTKRNETIFYLMRTDLIIDGNEEYTKRILQDTKHINEWIEEEKKELYIIGTYCDKIPNFHDEPHNENVNFLDNVNKNPTIKKLISHFGGRKKAKINFGSLSSKDSCEDLVYNIFSGENQ
ncbi:GTPase domain-containing protein [Thalassospira xiamenensis]|uniref:GTPase domain-containing protein n=1 Tax=Thalassospira xiamenensis TaxID=220697 RepID=UPI000DEDCD4C|nr:GTPase domain-containing protein [Thalassospira xiamenensis]RCK40217.1 hypothetical protein TH24_09645 [Thalassospira xiamenensis]